MIGPSIILSWMCDPQLFKDLKMDVEVQGIKCYTIKFRNYKPALLSNNIWSNNGSKKLLDAEDSEKKCFPL